MYAKINGTRIFFDVEGLQYVPDGPTMRERPVCFMLNGGPDDDHVYFLPHCDVLAQDMQLIFMDDRSCGLSDKAPLETSRLSQHVEDIEALRRYLGLEKIFIVGHSYGGTKTLAYMKKYPQNIKAVALVSASCSSRTRDTFPIMLKKLATPEQLKAVELFRAKDPSMPLEKYKKVMAGLSYVQISKPGNEQKVYDEIARSGANAEAAAYQKVHDMQNFDLVEEIRGTKIPSLIMTGERDHIIPPVHAEELAAAIENSELDIVKDAGHMIFFDRPDYILPRIRDFFYKHFSD